MRMAHTKQVGLSVLMVRFVDKRYNTMGCENMAIRVVAYDKSRFNSIEDALYEDSKNYQDASRPVIWYTNRRTGLNGDSSGAMTYNTVEEAQEEINEWVSNASVNGTEGLGWAILDEKSVISKSKKLSKSFNDMVQKQRVPTLEEDEALHDFVNHLEWAVMGELLQLKERIDRFTPPTHPARYEKMKESFDKFKDEYVKCVDYYASMVMYH